MRIERPWKTYFLASGLAVWSLGALGGGFGLVTAPDGSALRFDTSWLEATPFTDYRAPGLLLGALGAAETVSTVLVTRDLRAARAGRSTPGWHRLFTASVGLAHFGWIAGEIVLLWRTVRTLPPEVRSFFYAFWWVFGPLSTANLILAVTPSARGAAGSPGTSRFSPTRD